jgi:crossover junction endodeoxyribonuclease RuvC
MRKSKHAKTERVIGIDPGVERTGVGVIEISNNTPSVLFVDCIVTERTKSQSERIDELSLKLGKIIARFKPNRAAVEKLFFSANVKTAMSVSEARGCILLTLQRSGIPISEWTPQQIKYHVTGYGSADKQQVQKIVCAILHIATPPKFDDAADALAVALTAQNNPSWVAA